MINLKTFGAWLALCLATACGTAIVVNSVGTHLNLQQAVARFGR